MGTLLSRSLFGAGALLVAAALSQDRILILPVTWIWTALLAVMIARPHGTRASGLAFLRELTTALPFPIRKIQVDNGTEFPLAFALSCQDLGVRVLHPSASSSAER